MANVSIKRIYAPAEATDGYRVLVDRLWPRGVSKDKGKVDLWLKQVGPSNELRQWFGHKPEKFAEFAKKYRAELAENPAIDELRDVIKQHKAVTLLFGAKDETHNQAVVLAQFLNR